jgi:nucleotide-binding universal stress UspA family protein
MFMRNAQHLLLATDGSAHAIEAARTLQTIIPPHTLHRLTVLAVVRPPQTDIGLTFGGCLSTGAMQPLSPQIWDSLSTAMEAEQAAREQAAREAVAQTIAAVHGLAEQIIPLVRVGAPAEEIVHIARVLAADAIMVCGCERGRLHSFLFGSLSERVLRSAACPVFIVRPAAADRDRPSHPRGGQGQWRPEMAAHQPVAMPTPAFSGASGVIPASGVSGAQ